MMIRSLKYRGKRGFTVSGHDIFGRKYRVFTLTKKGAIIVDAAEKIGDHKAVDRVLLEGK